MSRTSGPPRPPAPGRRMAFASPFRRRRTAATPSGSTPTSAPCWRRWPHSWCPMIDAGDEATTRLFPPAYPGDDTPSEEAATGTWWTGPSATTTTRPSTS